MSMKAIARVINKEKQTVVYVIGDNFVTIDEAKANSAVIENLIPDESGQIQISGVLLPELPLHQMNQHIY